MRFITATIASMAAAAATATVIPRADYGGWNVTISHTGGNDRSRTETVSGVYANSGLTDNIPVTCHYQGLLNGEVIDKTTCDPESFSYVLQDGGLDDDGKNLYQLVLTQTVTLSGTNVTVKGVSDGFTVVSDKVTGKAWSSSDIIINASTAVA